MLTPNFGWNGGHEDSMHFSLKKTLKSRFPPFVCQNSKNLWFCHFFFTKIGACEWDFFLYNLDVAQITIWEDTCSESNIHSFYKLDKNNNKKRRYELEVFKIVMLGMFVHGCIKFFPHFLEPNFFLQFGTTLFCAKRKK